MCVTKSGCLTTALSIKDLDMLQQYVKESKHVESEVENINMENVRKKYNCGGEHSSAYRGYEVSKRAAEIQIQDHSKLCKGHSEGSRRSKGDRPKLN